MGNAFDDVPGPTLPPITISDAAKSPLAEVFADALRRGYTEADLRKQAMELVSQIIEMAKTFV